MLSKHYKELLKYCMRMSRDPDIAADLTQESYVRMLAMQQAGKVIHQPMALLKQIALHAKIDLDRRSKIRQHDDIADLEETEQVIGPRHLQPDELYASVETAQAYLDTINALPPRCREAFRMYLFDEITNKQIAERMGVSLGMVDQYIKRGKLACQARRKELESDN